MPLAINRFLPDFSEQTMDHLRLHSRDLSLAMVLGCMAAMGGLACGGTKARNTAGASGGAGGTSALGGSGSGGVGAGGDTSGGGGAGGTSGDGTGGSSTLPTIACTSDTECSASALFCEPAKKLCVQCVKSADCPSGGHCLGNACVSVAACNNSRDCSTDQVCDPARGTCVQCTVKEDCATGQICVSDRCVISACATASDCGAGNVCDTTSGKCVECAADTDCTGTTQHCVQNVCRTTCATDKTCTPLGMLCDTASSACVQCKVDMDCPASSYCSAGTCKADICDATQAMCLGSSIVPCNANGSGWSPVSNCPADKPCKVYGTVASCSGSPATDGGVIATGDGGGDIPAGACTTATVNPCASITKFAGTQTVDGKGDDFCQVPSFVFGATNAAKINNYNNVPLTQFESVTGRVAWSAAGLSAFFDVTDASVQTVNMADATQAASKAYQGDSIEIMISSSNVLTGLTGTDTNTLHVIVPANGPAVATKASNNGGTSTGTASTLPAPQYAQAVTPTGYAIEVRLPWPNGAAPASGAQIRFDLALNSADAKFGTIDDMRDGQLLYYVGTVGGTTTCQNSTDGTVPYCDDRTWCTTSAQ